MNDLQIVVNQQPGVITTNFDDVKCALSAQMEVYKELEVTEENKTERKRDVATLRKMIKAVNDKRIEVKKECIKPYDAFEKQASELVDIINEPVKLIDNQIKEFEDQQRLVRVNEIHQIFAELIGDLYEFISIEKIYDNKWENATTSKKSIKEDIEKKLNDIRNSVVAIKALQSEKAEEALNRYYDSLDLASSINFINRYEQQKREIELRMKEQQEREREQEIERERERIRREEREAIAREERIKADAEAKARADQEAKDKAEREAMIVKQQNTESELETKQYSVIATSEEHEQIQMYLNSIGVMFFQL
jgi:hypothetical protein